MLSTSDGFVEGKLVPVMMGIYLQVYCCAIVSNRDGNLFRTIGYPSVLNRLVEFLTDFLTEVLVFDLEKPAGSVPVLVSHDNRTENLTKPNQTTR